MYLKLFDNGRKKSCIVISSFILILLIILAVVVSVNHGKENKKVGTVVYGDTLNGKSNTIKLQKDKNGNVNIEENKLFKKYTIVVPNTNNNAPYKQKENYLQVDFDKSVELKLNSQASSNISKDICLTNDSAKKELIITTKYKNNNFVVINNQNNANKIVILISKVKKPFNRKVVLNAGHGGIDPGEIFGNIKEKDITLKIVKLMESDLEYVGIQVVLTRDKDVAQDLNDIGAFVNKVKPDAFMSVHINAMDTNRNSYQGIGAYYYDENGFQRDARIKFADIVLKHTVHKDGWIDDGVVRDRLRVLRLSKYPCVLMECGYLTNDNDRARLLNDTILGNLANNLSEGIAEFLGEK